MAKKKLDIEKLCKDEICQKWINYNCTEDQTHVLDWYRGKQQFWEDNKTHLENNGFKYGTNIGTALDDVSIVSPDKLDGTLLIVKVGSDKNPASQLDLDYVSGTFNQILEGVKGVRVVVTRHNFSVNKISLPQLRHLQSAVLSSCEPTENINPIISLDL